MTPYTPSKPPRSTAVSAPKPASASQASTQEDSEEEFYEWPPSDDEEISQAADKASFRPSMPPPMTPRKAVKTEALSTPGKRTFREMDNGDVGAWPTPNSASKAEDVFTTPATHSNGKTLFSATHGQDTPTPARFRDISGANGAESSLAADVLAILRAAKISLPLKVQNDLKDVCNKQNMFTQGVLRGRDVSRSLVAKRDEKIVELQSSIEALQSERETSRAVIRHLRSELRSINVDGG